uniref:Uncharacterized protein n=1 Tax=Tanacetum cinerariifolium TaxID=118510 RepID=A0A699H7M4_TANCI|nr:hypothetical protein [Tanacetum cinerariifolium]
MSTLKFAEVYNLVAFLSKPTESEGFEKIVDFQNANPIQYALTLQALVDGKKVIITKSTVRRDLQLEDAEGVDYLSNAAIFEQLTLQLKGMSTNNRIYVTPSHTKKIFENMRRVGKCLFGRETPLFPTMMVQAQEEMGADTEKKNTELPQTSGPTTNIADEAVNEEMDDSLVRAAITASSLEAEQDSRNINKTQSKTTPNELSSQGTDSDGGPRCQKTIGETIAHTRSENATQTNEIDSLKRRVKKLENKQRSRTHKLKRLYKVSLTARVESSDEDDDLGKDASKQGRINDIDADEGITLVSTHDDEQMFDADQDLGGEEVFVAKQDENVVEKEVDATQVQVSTAATTATISIDEVTLAQALALVEESSKKAEAEIMKQESSKRAGTELEQESSKKQKIDDDKEIAELKQYYCHYKEVIAAQDEVSAAQELQRNILSTYYC